MVITRFTRLPIAQEKKSTPYVNTLEGDVLRECSSGVRVRRFHQGADLSEGG